MENAKMDGGFFDRRRPFYIFDCSDQSPVFYGMLLGFDVRCAVTTTEIKRTDSEECDCKIKSIGKNLGHDDLLPNGGCSYAVEFCFRALSCCVPP